MYTASGNSVRIHMDLAVPRGPSSRLSCLLDHHGE